MSDSTDLAVREATEAAIAAQQEEEIDADLLTIPMLKVAQKLTREVDEGSADPGEFVNTLLGAGVGSEIGFIIVEHHKGRAAQGPNNRYFVSDDFDTIPATWEDHPLVGSEFVGTRFQDHPDAEEQFKIAVNEKRREWEKGAPIKTTHIFTGIAIVSPIQEEGEDLPDEYQPVRLSVKISNKDNKALVSQILTIKKLQMRNKAYWDRVFDLKNVEKSYGGGKAFTTLAKLGRSTTEEEREMALDLYTAVMSGRVEDNEAASSTADREAAMETKGGLDV